MQLARRSGDRHRDVSDEVRADVVEFLHEQHAADHLIKLVAVGGALEAEELATVVGESLPLGLRLVE